MSRRTSHSSSDEHFPRRRLRIYVVKDGKPVLEKDMKAIGECIADKEKRRIAYTELQTPDGVKIGISTMFTCVDRRFLNLGPPALWETLISWLGNGLDGWQRDYTNVNAAQMGHDAAVAMIKAALLEEQKDL